MKNQSENLIRKAIRRDYLQPIWQNLCNLYNDCSKCPLQKGYGTCYDRQDRDYDEFEKFLTGKLESKSINELTEEQKNCPYCHNFDGHGTDLFECGNKYADASIELDDNAISFDNLDGHRTYGMFKINYCPICGRKLEA